MVFFQFLGAIDIIAGLILLLSYPSSPLPPVWLFIAIILLIKGLWSIMSFS